MALSMSYTGKAETLLFVCNPACAGTAVQAIGLKRASKAQPDTAMAA
jgi:hypothetical protein